LAEGLQSVELAEPGAIAKAAAEAMAILGVVVEMVIGVVELFAEADMAAKAANPVGVVAGLIPVAGAD